MAYVILGTKPVFLQKRLTTVGTDAGLDLEVAAKMKGLLFTLESASGISRVIPSQKIRVNDQAVSSPIELKSCDRLEWDGGAMVFINSNSPPAEEHEKASDTKMSSILGLLASALDRGAPLDGVLQSALDVFLEMSGAEAGFFLSSRPPHGNWEVIHHRRADSEHSQITRKDVFSNTLVAEAVRKRDIVYVESIVGSQWGSVPSMVASRIFSAACIPLSAGDTLLGAILLISRSPGRSIKRTALPEISTLATVTAWMIRARQALGLARAESHALRLQSGHAGPTILSSDSSPMKVVLERVERLAPSPLAILILGETGVGKELIANAVHAQSPRAAKPFIAVNCAAIPGPLLESVLFGHEKGAFTGAVKSQDGKFVQANGGTLFLDEIGDLPLDLQAKLLRVLQEGVVDPVGAAKPVKVDIRIVAATHQDLATQVREGKFREDLFYRIAGATVSLPPLRDRPSDIPLLAAHFLESARPGMSLTEDAIQKLKAHSWPGNIRELAQTMTRAAYCAPGMAISADLVEFLSAPGPRSAEGAEFSIGDGAGLFAAQNQFTRSFVERTLKRADGNRTEAARRLGISERTLYRILSESDTPVMTVSPH